MIEIGLINLDHKLLNCAETFLQHSQFLYDDIVQEGREWIQKNRFIALIIVAFLGPAFLALPLIISKSFYAADFTYQLLTSLCLSGLVIASTQALFNTWRVHMFDSYTQGLPFNKLHTFLIQVLYQFITNTVFILICFTTIIFNFYASSKGQSESITLILSIYVSVILWGNHYLKDIALLG